MLWFFVALAVALVLFFACLVYAYRRAFWSNRRAVIDYYKFIDDEERFPGAKKMRVCIDDMLSLDTERVEILSHDGLRLVGYYVHTQDGAPLQIMFHGYKSAWQRDFSGLCPLARSLGFNVLLVDQRAHGKSEGRVISYGVNESLDVISWVEYAISRFGEDVRIVLAGVSMGGATVLSALGRRLPSNVVAITADSPFSSAEGVIVKVGASGGLPAWVVSPLARVSARVFGGFRLREISPIMAVKDSKIPIFLVHGTADSLVPYEMSEELTRVNSKIHFVSFEGAEHVGSFMLDTERYLYEYKKFFRENNLL